jgi:hypothetical protein
MPRGHHLGINTEFFNNDGEGLKWRWLLKKRLQFLILLINIKNRPQVVKPGGHRSNRIKGSGFWWRWCFQLNTDAYLAFVAKIATGPKYFRTSCELFQSQDLLFA